MNRPGFTRHAKILGSGSGRLFSTLSGHQGTIFETTILSASDPSSEVENAAHVIGIGQK